MTESTLLFFFYLDNVLKVDAQTKHKYDEQQNNFINWLFSTSGFYDKTVKGNYFNFDAHQIKTKKGSVYNKYFTIVLEFVRFTDTVPIMFHFHQMHEDIDNLKDLFFEFIGYNKNLQYDEHTEFLQSIRGKDLLIINNLGALMKAQYEQGKSIPASTAKSVNYYHNGYTFLNNGYYDNIIQNAEKICEQLNSRIDDSNLVIISAGAYSVLIAYYLIKKHKKTVFIIGGNLPFYFGIRTKRVMKFFADKIDEKNFINVPDSLRPACHYLIEDGCYW